MAHRGSSEEPSRPSVNKPQETLQADEQTKRTKNPLRDRQNLLDDDFSDDQREEDTPERHVASTAQKPRVRRPPSAEDLDASINQTPLKAQVPISNAKKPLQQKLA